LNDTLGVKEFEIGNLKKEVASLKQIAETQVIEIYYFFTFSFFSSLSNDGSRENE